MHKREVVECKNFSCCFTDIDSTKAAFSTILKMFANICHIVSFQYSYRWQIGQLELLCLFSWKFSETCKTAVFGTSREKCKN